MAKKKSANAKRKAEVTLSDPKSLGRLEAWSRFAPKSVFPLERGSRAGVVVDNKGTPRLFVFNTEALLDILSEVDERLVDRLSDKEYHSKKSNPAGWLIDELEAKLPVNPVYANTLREAIDEAERKGWIPLSDIEKKFALV